MGCTFHLHIVQPGIDLIPALTNFDFGYKKFGYPKFWPCKTLENLLGSFAGMSAPIGGSLSKLGMFIHS